ncbi:Protein stu-1 [Tolypocladium ophioglossoides CBS 100239]|uniref:Protein stu-1 n=1 Tax=Tolypocladium ophioglossoides (strain CBS 100239) TaxID=1163406 RepID=A0A0L0N3R5_TOLOC|nr:Protein stu-1 [Tolypocladium ophioglossoides CBS 100239]
MADGKLSEQQVADLVTMLRGDASLDAKVQHVTTVKSGIKQHNVPEACVAQLFDALRAASASQHAALVNAGFTALGHLLTRLSRQDPKLLAKEAARTLPVVADKLGDLKDKYRALAAQALSTIYAVAPADVERVLRNSAMSGKNPRAKEGGMHWLLQTHKEQGLQFRSYVPLLMELLEDADGMVRDTAKSTVIELFKTAPNAAKSDLKRQLKNFKVRPAIEQAIVKAFAPTAGRPDTPSDAAPEPRRPNLAASVSSVVSERPMTPMVVDAEPIEPMYVNTNRELDDIFRDMAWHFEGKETEQNWLKREQSMGTLRKLNAGNVPADFLDTFVAGLRSLLDGIIKAMTSLRTSLSKEGCGLIQDIAVTLGPALDPMVELLMQTLVKLSAGTKKISSQQANATVDTIISRVTYSPRLMQHVWGACQDKNVQPRLYSSGWLQTLLKKEAHHKSHVEHTGGVDLMEKCIKKGLGDPNPGVREKMRSTYWAFWGVWPARADAIMADLDSTAHKLLNKDPHNPNSPKKSADAPPPRPGLGLSRSTMTSSKPSLREAMLAQKKALASKNLPARPGSAMAHISHVRTTSNSSSQPAASAKSAGTRARGEPTISVKAGGMSVAPMRPARRRPEMAARPATAGPYSVRDQPASMEVDSPESLKSKAVTPKPRETTPRRTAPRPRPGHATHASESSAVSPAARTASKIPSPRGSPSATLKQSRTAIPSSSPAKANEDMALVVPKMSSFRASLPLAPAPPKIPAEMQSSLAAAAAVPPEADLPAPRPETPSRTLRVYEDPFNEDQSTPKPTFTVPVLEDKPVNEDAANLQTANGQEPSVEQMDSPEKIRQNSRLLDSGITKIKAKSLEVHGFRKLQSLIRDSKTIFTDEKFEALLLGVFQYLEDPLAGTPSDKAQDVKAQILATIKLLLKKERDNFQPHVSKGLESLLQTRGAYDTRAHVVSGLELLADELVTLGDGPEMVVVLTRRLHTCADTSLEGCRTLSMGLHVLKEMLDKRAEFVPTEGELAHLAGLAGRCLDSAASGVRMDAVKFCVSLHDRVGEGPFWDALRGVKEDPKSLITYYIVKRQREQGIVPTTAAAA